MYNPLRVMEFPKYIRYSGLSKAVSQPESFAAKSFFDAAFAASADLSYRSARFLRYSYVQEPGTGTESLAELP